ncbi:class I SAM-dependent methyltransferase [Streptomyces sp. NBC_01016]|uniref:class I SAM-dependent methyltransferase n=1 Tax=Streptomyces sp. NBC_01016 TaxID=2903720 RepID=UPI00224DD276|nr:class I SAM-dependent methyltransferase [Streptomyces sp. NBC_01016]MCX4833514.1 class I SAM-dependent methyltransferase [Streptomyces sp. NBC_01016]
MTTYGGTSEGAIDWDAMAGEFDDEPDHGLRDPEVRAAWAERLAGWLPEEAGDVVDIGCGTGSMSLLAAERGHRVTGVDSAPGMLELARRKLVGRDAEFLLGDAAEPPVAAGAYDVVFARHVLWMLPDVAAVLGRWVSLLRPGGRLVLVEGVWGEVRPAGIPGVRLADALAPLVADVRREPLAGDARLWGREVADERYAVVAVM